MYLSARKERLVNKIEIFELIDGSLESPYSCFPVLFWISLVSTIRWIQLQLVTESFSTSLIHSCLFGVMVTTPDWESVGCEFKYRNFGFGMKGLV